MTRHRTALACSVVALAYCAVAGGAEPGKPGLKMFGGRPNPHGLWKTELLEASDERLMANARTLAETAVCMDAALELAKDVKPSESACTQAVLKNTTAEAQIEKECPGEGTTVTTMRRESKDSILFETVVRGKGGVTSTIKGRYHYVGPCSPDDNLMKADQNSEVCQKARADAATMDPAAGCGELEGAGKTDCIRRSQAALEARLKLCE